jgi:hypothetical protein
MAFFGDMQQAVEDYPSIALTYAFEDFEVVDGTDGVINVNEIWKFRVRVSNSGALNMNNVTLHIDGENGVEVGTDPAGPFTGGNITTTAITVPAHTGRVTGFYYFKAPASESNGVEDLLNVHINSWDADLNQILLDKSGHSIATVGVYADEVHP